MTDKKTPLAAAALAAALTLAAAPAHADGTGGEGMWLPSQLPAIAERYDGTGPIRTNPRPVSGPADVLEILQLAW